MQPKGSSFEGNDKAYLRVKLGTTPLIPAVDEALRGMRVGGVRRLIIPESLGYPNADFKNWQPAPTTFSVRTAPLDALCRNLLETALFMSDSLGAAGPGKEHVMLRVCVGHRAHDI